MTRFYFRAAYAAVLMASMSLTGNAADIIRNEGIAATADSDSFGENHIIAGDNITISSQKAYYPAVQILKNDSNVVTYSLQASSGGDITITGVLDGVSVSYGDKLIIGNDNVENVQISSSATSATEKRAESYLLKVERQGTLVVDAKDIYIHGVLNKEDKDGVVTSERPIIRGIILGSSFDTTSESVVTIGGSLTESIRIDVQSDGEAIGIEALAPGRAELNAKNISIAASFRAVDNSQAEIQLGSEITDSLTLRADAGYALFNETHGTVNIQAKSISLKGGTTAGTASVYNDSGVVCIGSDVTEEVSIVAIGAEADKHVAAGLSTIGEGTTTVKGKNISIQSVDTSVYSERGKTIVSAGENLEITGRYGVKVQGNDEDQLQEYRSSAALSAKNISVTAESVGLSATSYGILDVNGNLEVNAPTAIEARGNSTININTDASKGYKTVINGDIVYAIGSGTGNILDAEVNLNLSGEGSRWTGNVVTVTPETVTPDDDNKTVKSMHLSLSDGAQWNVTGSDLSTEDGSKAAYANINTLALNAGVINMDAEGAPESVKVDKLEGTGGTINARAAVQADGTIKSSTLTVGEVVADKPLAMAVNYKGITSDALTAENTKDLKALDIVSGAASVSEYVEEGDINGAWTRQDGEGDGSFQANTKLTDFSSVNAMSLVQWRNEINHLTKRLGDIRASEGTIGAWARVYGGESQWGGANEVEMDHTTIQVGGDYRINNHWIAGAAFSYTDSRADLSNGDADGDSYSLAVYGTYTADGGSFLDVIGRYGYLKNDITAGNMALDTSSSAFSLSAEMGHTFRFINDAAYVEPQLEFTYGFISGDDATASNGVRIDQDDFQSFVTRVGVRAGYDFPQKKGSVYGMFSYSYDWMGDADGTASKDGLRQALSQDLGGGWVTYGVGAQIMLGDSAYFYGELERTSGGDIDNPYLFSAGVRMTF